MVSDFIITDWQAVAINAELFYDRLKIGSGKHGRPPAGTGKPVGRPVASCRRGPSNHAESPGTGPVVPDRELVDSRRVARPAHEIRAAQKDLNDPYWCNEWLDAVASKRCYDVGASELFENT